MSDRPVPQLNPSRIQLSEHVRNSFSVTVDDTILPDDMLAPTFWSHVAARMQPFDRIEVRSESGSFFAEYVVISTDRIWAKVALLHFIDFKTALTRIQFSAELLDQYEIVFRGPQHKWSVIRKLDRSVAVEKLQTRVDAQDWLMKEVGEKKAA